jgi:hypothetical protein
MERNRLASAMQKTERSERADSPIRRKEIT